MLNELDRAKSALCSIPPDLNHDQWVRVGMAFHDAGGDFDTFDQWSEPAASYNIQSCRATWRSFKSTPGGISVGTLFGMARDHGWSEGKTSSRPAPVPCRPIEQVRKPAPGMSAYEIWNRCDAATNTHKYIAAKCAQGAPLDALRVVPLGDSLQIAGQSMVGALMVPAYAPNGEMQSAQFIPPPDAGMKMNLPGAMNGATFTVGKIAPGGVVFIVEGIGQAWACWQATGAAAVVSFGACNMGKVAKALREQNPSARLVLVPDVGQEIAAVKIAADVGAAIATMPEGEDNNFDANDLAQRDGYEVLELLLEAATEPPKPKPMVHPLARFVDIESRPKPPRWVIPGFIGHGVTVIAGAHGVGKTTALLPLAMTAAGLHGDELLPRQWRHVIYITEDVEQARRILAGIVGYSNVKFSLDQVRERLHIAEAVRLDPVFVATVGKTYREQFTRTVEGVEVLPLVVLDTKSAVLALENENDNSEASRMMAALKQGFDGLPVWLIGHISKADLTRKDALTSRGASAIEGDANQTIFLIREGESRYLVQGKTRFEAKWPELEITSFTAKTTEPDEFGNLEEVLLRWGIAAPAQKSRKEASEQATEQHRKDDEACLRQVIRDAVEVAWLAGHPLNREGVKANSKRKHSEAISCLETMLAERWLHEVFIPPKERLHPRKSSFFVNLTTVEHEAVLSGAGLPAAKLVIPASWRKAPISIMPGARHECARKEVIDHE